jgi:type IX secretion system PorP/SprF family membrane protein
LYANCQDVQFSQFYTAIQYQNPAFAGSSHDLRTTFHQRVQWPNLESRYTTSLFAIDYYLKKSGIGLGAMFIRDWQGVPTITTNDFKLQLSKQVRINEESFIRFGIQGGFITRNLNDSYFQYSQDYDNQGYKGNTFQSNYTNSISYFDISSGIVYYNKNFWVGGAMHNINQPNQSFIDKKSFQPIKYSFTTGYRHVMNKLMEKQKNKPNHHHIIDISISPVVHYKYQGKSDQLDFGLAFQYHEWIMGLWYRGIPVKNYNGIINNESAVSCIGYVWNNIRFTYSYDLIISKLRKASPHSAHEINLTCLLPSKNPSKKVMKRLPCPDI